MRRLLRTAPAWRSLVHAGVPATEEDRAAVAAQFVDAASVTFATDLDAEQLASALAAPDGSTEAPAGDARIGGVLVIGDPIRTAEVAAILGPRAFGGTVVVAESSGDPSQVSESVERDLSAARGTVLAVVDAVPTAGQIDDLESSTPATVAWISASGTAAPAGVTIAADPQSLRAVLVDLTSGTDAAGQFFALCGALPGLGLDDESTIDPATIIAPDPQAQVAIAYAHAQLGEPYVSDPPRARPPDSWDCSKLTTAAWAAAGVRLTPLSYTQAEEVQTIPRALVQPGDLVFWLRSGAHHVALVDQVDASGQVWITEAANPSAGVRRRALGGSWDDTYMSGFGRVIRST
jgi:cell wall-associated NlpC family hydrolase